MNDGKLKQYFMTIANARKLKGKVIESIERDGDGDGVRIIFTDGTAISVAGDRPQYGRLMVYYWTTAAPQN